MLLAASESIGYNSSATAAQLLIHFAMAFHLSRSATPAAAMSRPIRNLSLLGLLLSLAGPLAGVGQASGTAAPEGAAPAPQATAPAVAPQPAAASATAISSSRQIVLELGRRTISLIEGDKVVRSWPVAIGDPQTPTPTGTFQVLNKVTNPQYQSTRTGRTNPTIGPNGPLGDRWLGFHTRGADQFGIHGTPPAWEWTVTSRAAVSHGCVRMLTPHVRELFDRVEVGTPVIVRR